MPRDGDIDVKPTAVIIRQYKTQITREFRKLANRVLRDVRKAAPKSKPGKTPKGKAARHRSGNLRRQIKSKVRWDAEGPYARITTSARRRTRSERTGKTTSFRYGLAKQQKDHYLQRGLQRTPRR